MNIPAELVEPLIERHLRTHSISLEDLSEQVGFHQATIRRRLDEGTLTFEMVDLILAKTYNFMAWYREPLLNYYWNNQVPPDLNKPVKCENPECEEWFALNSDPGPHDSSWVRQRYCSYSCQHRHWHIKTRRSQAEEGWRICADPSCGRSFYVERSHTSGGWVSKKFCSGRCARRESVRAFRRRQRERIAA